MYFDKAILEKRKEFAANLRLVGKSYENHNLERPIAYIERQRNIRWGFSLKAKSGCTQCTWLKAE